MPQILRECGYQVANQSTFSRVKHFETCDSWNVEGEKNETQGQAQGGQPFCGWVGCQPWQKEKKTKKDQLKKKAWLAHCDAELEKLLQRLLSAGRKKRERERAQGRVVSLSSWYFQVGKIHNHTTCSSIFYCLHCLFHFIWVAFQCFASTFLNFSLIYGGCWPRVVTFSVASSVDSASEMSTWVSTVCGINMYKYSILLHCICMCLNVYSIHFNTASRHANMFVHYTDAGDVRQTVGSPGKTYNYLFGWTCSIGPGYILLQFAGEWAQSRSHVYSWLTDRQTDRHTHTFNHIHIRRIHQNTYAGVLKI